MQTLRSFSLSKLILIIALSATTIGCTWKKTMAFKSPSGRCSVEIWQTRIANEWGTRVRLVSPTRSTFVFENRREAIVYFVHVYWSPDESKAGVITAGTNGWELAYDVQTGKEIPFETIREDIAASIRKTYQVPTGDDPIRWAGSADAQNDFFRLHPEIRLSYR